MTIIERSDYSLAVLYTPTAPALDLEEFFANGQWKLIGNLSKHQKLILNQGQRFLTLAIEGRTIGLNTVNEATLEVDLPAIKAYLLSYRAYKKSPELSKVTLEEVLKVTESVLNHLTNEKSDNKHSEQTLEQNDVNVAQSFFRYLSTIPIKADE